MVQGYFFLFLISTMASLMDENVWSPRKRSATSPVVRIPYLPTGVLGGTVLDYGWEGVRGSLGSGLGLG